MDHGSLLLLVAVLLVLAIAFTIYLAVTNRKKRAYFDKGDPNVEYNDQYGHKLPSQTVVVVPPTTDEEDRSGDVSYTVEKHDQRHRR